MKRCDENTIGVVPTLGLTFTCSTSRSRPSRRRSTSCRAHSGLDIPIHVDAASGGFIAPFLQPELAWDFRLPRVKSINTSGHKFGLAPLGVRLGRSGATTEDLPEELIFNVELSRRQHADLRAELLAAGRSDHRAVLQLPAARPRRLPRIQQACADTARLARRGDRQARLFEMLYDGRGGMPGRRLDAQGRPRPRLHPLRSRRPAAHARLAGARRTRCRRTAATSSCSAFWCATA